MKNIEENIKTETVDNKIQIINCKCGKSIQCDWNKIPNTEATVCMKCPHCNSILKIENPYFDKELYQKKEEEIQKEKEKFQNHRKIREAFKADMKNKFNSKLVQDDKQIDAIRREFSICKDGLNYISGSNIPNNQNNFEQIIVTSNNIYFNLDNEVKVIIDDKAKCEKVINCIKRELKSIKENSEKKLSHIKSSSKNEIHIIINNENYFLTKLVTDEPLKSLFEYLLSDIKNIIFYDRTPMTAADWEELDKTINEIYADSIAKGDLFWAASTKKYMRTLTSIDHETLKSTKNMLLAISHYKDIFNEFQRCITKLSAGKGEYLDDGDGLVIENITAKDIHELTHLPLLCVYDIFALLKKNPEKTKELLRTKYNFKG